MKNERQLRVGVSVASVFVVGMAVKVQVAAIIVPMTVEPSDTETIPVRSCSTDGTEIISVSSVPSRRPNQDVRLIRLLPLKSLNWTHEPALAPVIPGGMSRVHVLNRPHETIYKKRVLVARRYHCCLRLLYMHY